MGSDVGIFWRELRCGLGNGVGHGYGGVVGRDELGRDELGRGEVSHGKVGHELTVEVNGF